LADQLDGEWRELAQQLARTPAKTADGLIAKLAPVVAPHAEDDEDGTFSPARCATPWDKSAFNSQYAVKTRGAFHENQGDRASIAHRSPDRSTRSPV
jgi:hypothetical protein